MNYAKNVTMLVTNEKVHSVKQERLYASFPGSSVPVDPWEYSQVTNPSSGHQSWTASLTGSMSALVRLPDWVVSERVVSAGGNVLGPSATMVPLVVAARMPWHFVECLYIYILFVYIRRRMSDKDTVYPCVVIVCVVASLWKNESLQRTLYTWTFLLPVVCCMDSLNKT